MAKRNKRTYYGKYTKVNFLIKLGNFLWLLLKDLIYTFKHGRTFKEYGLTLYAGRQGAGKTMAMVEYLERMRTLHPKCLIYTNFGYKHQTGEFMDWNDFFNIRNGEDGVIFAIDEIQNEFASTAWKNFPETLLSEITQQRKQKIKIVGTSQVFTRVVKPLREQTFEVVECFTFLGRWTFTKAFDAQEYESVVDQPVLKNKLHRLWRRNFIQDNNIRELYDSYAKIERMKKTTYLDRSQRLG